MLLGKVKSASVCFAETFVQNLPEKSIIIKLKSMINLQWLYQYIAFQYIRSNRSDLILETLICTAYLLWFFKIKRVRILHTVIGG